MYKTSAYQEGFIKAAQEYGFSEREAVEFLSQKLANVQTQPQPASPGAGISTIYSPPNKYLAARKPSSGGFLDSLRDAHRPLTLQPPRQPSTQPSGSGLGGPMSRALRQFKNPEGAAPLPARNIQAPEGQASGFRDALERALTRQKAQDGIAPMPERNIQIPGATQGNPAPKFIPYSGTAN